jgi:hypothetical protein
LLQLAKEVAGEWTPQNFIWEKAGHYYDALRPAVEPEGLYSPDEVLGHRQYHIAKVKKLFRELDILVFTLGLTEMWMHKESGTVYPTAPGAIIGDFDPNAYQFMNAQFGQIIEEFNEFQNVLRTIRSKKPFKVLLTVSPVPLTATASGGHVLTSTIYSKSILRGVAGQLSTNQAHIDYFPSYEIVTNPALRSNAFDENLRSVRKDAVDVVMRHFFSEHAQLGPSFGKKEIPADASIADDTIVQCEESLLGAFGGK